MNTEQDIIDRNHDSQIRLSPNQQKAVTCTDKYIAVVAGPGSGKTRVLTERINHLITNCEVQDTKILALTFSSKAANEVRKRLKTRLGVRACRIEAKTFHSFGLGLIRQNADLLGFSDSIDIVSSTERYRIIRKLIEKQSGIRSELSLAEIQAYAQSISNIKGGANVSDYRMHRLCDAYNSELRRGNYIDFDDMVGLAHELLIRFPDIRKAYKQRYEHVLIDEVQDANAWQIDMIRGVVGSQTTLFVVGDDDQCIYEWRGAMPSYLKGLTSNKAFTVIHLEENYRSEQTIVKASTSFINRNMNRIQKHILSKKQQQPKVVSSTYAYWLANESAEADFVARKILELVERENYSYSDVTILARQHRQFAALRGALEKYSIPFICQEESGHYDSFLPVLQAIANINHKGNINRAVNYPNRVMDNFLYQDLKEKYSLPSDATVHQVFDYLMSTDDEFEDCEVFRLRYGLIRELSEKAKFFTVTEIINRLVDFYSSTSADIQPGTLSGATSLIPLAEDFDAGYVSSMTAKSSLEEFLDYIQLSEDDDSWQEKTDQIVNLMTCHRSKGLEFPIVFIPGVQCGLFPDNKHIKCLEDLEAERRLLYVSMTRAIDRLYLSAYDDPYSGQLATDSNGNKLFSYRGFMADIPDIILQRN